MSSQDDHIWQGWVEYLKQWGLQEFAASLLEVTAPINLVGAQMVYVSQPVLGGILPLDHLNALASMLEEPEQTKAFVNYLREVDE